MMDELERIANAKYNRGHISKVSQLHRQSVTSRASCDAKKEIKISSSFLPQKYFGDQKDGF